jgi:MFS family permease
MTFDTSEKRASSNLPQTFIAFRNYNYRLWFFGQLISLVGTWMQTTAQAYLIYELTHDPAYLGYVAFAAGLPTWIFTLYGGLISDRVSRRTMLIVTQAVMMLLAFILTGLVFAHLVQPWMIIVLAFLLGTANAFDAPARMAFVVEIVIREDIPNAIALNASMFNLATVVGPAVSGLTYALVGPAWCFFINGLSFIAVIAGLFLMKITAQPRRTRQGGSLYEIKEGLRFVAKNDVIIMILVNLALVSMLSMGLVSLLPAWSNQVLGGDVTFNGYLLSARGVGSLISALLLAYLSGRPVKGRLWALGSLMLPISIFLFVFMTWLWPSLAAMVWVGLAFMMIANTSNALVQDLTPDDLRGRVMSIYTLVFFGMAPIGGLLLGLLASWTTAPIAVGAANILLLIVVVGIQMLRPKMVQLK